MISPGSTPAAGGLSWADLALLPGVGEAVAEARAMVDRLLMHRVLRTRTAAVAAESALRGARASAALAGVDVPLDEVRSGAVGAPVLEGALRVAAELPRLRTVWRSSPRQALARLHLLAAAGLTTPDLLGRPVDEAAAGALARIAALVAAPATVPAVVVAAVVHGELAAVAPFADGSGVVARAAFRLSLADRGLDTGLLVTSEVGSVELADYLPALAAYAGDGPAGVGRWLVHCADSVRLGARDSLAVAEAMVRG